MNGSHSELGKRHMRDKEAEVADADSRVCEWNRAIGQ